MKLRLACALAALLLSACGQEPAAVATPAPKAVASFQEVMLSVVDPAADALWNAVYVSIDQSGESRAEPTTDEEWLALRRHAITLIESTNLAVMERPLLHPGAAIEFAEYYPSPVEIQARIDANRPAFVQMTQSLQVAAMQALAAIDKKDVAALEQSGETIDLACEACHQTFWYKME
jgi:cytochrome c556